MLNFFYFLSYKPFKTIRYSNIDKMALFLKKFGYLNNKMVFYKIHCFIFLILQALSFGSITIKISFIV